MKKPLSVGLLTVLAFSFAGVVQAQAPVYTGTCDLSQISYVATDAVSGSVVKKTFTDVPNAAVTFTVNVGGCAKIDVATTIASDSQRPLTLQILFDGNPSLVIVPGTIEVTPALGGRKIKASFILPVEDGLGAGSHNVTLQWKSASKDIVLSSKTSVVVYHN
jgi:hypothetical protein